MRLGSIPHGFTLIELLVVMAVLGILASVVLAALDPLEQINRARDADIKQNTSQVANAVTNYIAGHNGDYPINGLSRSALTYDPELGQTPLVAAGELKEVVPEVFLFTDVNSWQVYTSLQSKQSKLGAINGVNTGGSDPSCVGKTMATIGHLHWYVSSSDLKYYYFCS